MNSQEIQNITSQYNACITAPAGHGKTEMIADIVSVCTKRILVLTHTNAGVDAIRNRLIKKKVDPKNYRVKTIAGFCIEWCNSYPSTANFDTSISPITESEKYYKQLYPGTRMLFQNNKWAGEVLRASYSAIIADEYQDCIIMQHEIFLALNQYLPLWILGDPLQGIFGFKDPLVDWKTIPFKQIEIETSPWRWNNSNPPLGQFLSEIREQLLSVLDGTFPVKVSITEDSRYLVQISPEHFNCYSILSELKQYTSVLYITDFENNQINFCKEMGGIFQEDEKQDCTTLYEHSKKLDELRGVQKELEVFNFISSCASHVGDVFRSYLIHLKNGNTDFSRIRRNHDVSEMITSIDSHDIKDILPLFEWCKNNSELKFYRKELFDEMIRSIKYAATNDMSIMDASKHIRSDSKLQKRYSSFKYLASRTVLSKGLEFDCVIIDAQKIKRAKDFYVAMTRAKKMIYLISESNTLSFSK